MKRTRSLCPKCKAIIPATISVDTGAAITKHCWSCHETYSALIEPSAQWYRFCERINSPKFYDGYMIDVTSKCNIQCQYCYHNNGNETPVTSGILDKIRENAHHAPIIITGGEPTLNEDLALIISEASKYGPYIVLTNGVKLAQREYFDKFAPILDSNGILQVGLSFHPESNGADREFLEMCRDSGKRIVTAFIVIDNIEKMAEALVICNEYADVVCSFRIKAASNLGRETKVVRHIYTSQMVDYVIDCGGTINTDGCNKISYASMDLYGIPVYLISWYNLENVDLNDIDGPPYYDDGNGNSYNLVTSCLMKGAYNEPI